MYALRSKHLLTLAISSFREEMESILASFNASLLKTIAATVNLLLDMPAGTAHNRHVSCSFDRSCADKIMGVISSATVVFRSVSAQFIPILPGINRVCVWPETMKNIA
jgi:hypothetical protein